jgi:16S rRNA (cytosine967-C5)-methyltransferase
MRNFLRRRDEIKFPEDEIKSMSLTYSYPEEICELFLSIYGKERACRVLDFYNKAPKMTLRVNTLKVSVDDYKKILSDNGIESERSELVPDALIIGGMDFHAIPYSDEGYFFVQDVASQICVEATGAAPDEFIIDTCSCPGSKSFGMAIKMKNMGKVISCDLHKSKLSLVDKGAERLSIDIIETREIDGRKTVEDWIGKADRVLCDVPCSGLGVIGKKPEIRYKKLGDIKNLPSIQLDILRNASKYVKVGGTRIYSTCTVIPEENEFNIKKFLSEHPDFEPCDFNIGGIKSSDGYITLHPDIHGTDGFFVCRMTRKG